MHAAAHEHVHQGTHEQAVSSVSTADAGPFYPSNLTVCKPGYGGNNCNVCPAGTVSMGGSNAACTPCAAGRSVPNADRTACGACNMSHTAAVCCIMPLHVAPATCRPWKLHDAMHITIVWVLCFPTVCCYPHDVLRRLCHHCTALLRSVPARLWWALLHSVLGQHRVTWRRCCHLHRLRRLPAQRRWRYLQHYR